MGSITYEGGRSGEKERKNTFQFARSEQVLSTWISEGEKHSAVCQRKINWMKVVSHFHHLKKKQGKQDRGSMPGLN